MSETDIIKRLTEKKGNVVAIAKLPADGDRHLRLVCIEIRGNEYVVWTCNTEVMMQYTDCGCTDGDYFTEPKHPLMRASDANNLPRALLRFTERLAGKCRW